LILRVLRWRPRRVPCGARKSMVSAPSRRGRQRPSTMAPAIPGRARTARLVRWVATTKYLAIRFGELSRVAAMSCRGRPARALASAVVADNDSSAPSAAVTLTVVPCAPRLVSSSRAILKSVLLIARLAPGRLGRHAPKSAVVASRHRLALSLAMRRTVAPRAPRCYNNKLVTHRRAPSTAKCPPGLNGRRATSAAAAAPRRKLAQW